MGNDGYGLGAVFRCARVPCPKLRRLQPSRTETGPTSHNLPFGETIQVVSVPLHHLGALFKVFCSVVGSAHFVPLHVCKLPLNPIPMKTVLVECRGRDRPESMGDHLCL